MTNVFRLELLDQDWLDPSESHEDLCSHGHLRLTIGGVEVIGEDESYGISESALAMLRTLSADHTPHAPLAERMVFHGCGNILMMSCPIGADFSVRHRPGLVRIEDVVRYDSTNEDEAVRFPQLEVELSDAEYQSQVVGFARTARELFVGAVKTFEDDFDAQEYQAFLGEFDELLARYGHAA